MANQEEVGQPVEAVESDLVQRYLGYVETARYCQLLRSELCGRLKDEFDQLERSLLQLNRLEQSLECVEELESSLQILLVFVEELERALDEGSLDCLVCQLLVRDAHLVLSEFEEVAGLEMFAGIECLQELKLAPRRN